VAIGDPCFGKTYDRLRAALVEAVVMPHARISPSKVRIIHDWRCVLCEKRWAMSPGDPELRHLSEPHNADCVLASPFNRL
jgi:hypothetical protein